MFTRIKKSKPWKISSDPMESGIRARACVELPVPVKYWRALFYKPDVMENALCPEAETWGFKYDLYNGEYALGAIYKGEDKPVLFLTSPDIFQDFLEFLQEGLELVDPAFSSYING